MKKIELKTIVKEYESKDELDKETRELMELAQKAAENAYAPYSGFCVGAAILLENGEIFTGNNQENMAYPSGLCAERVAIFNASAKFPKIPVSSIAITAKSGKFEVAKPVAPCGACRQVISEYELKHKNKIQIALMGEKGKVFIIDSISELLPLGFEEKGLTNH